MSDSSFNWDEAFEEIAAANLKSSKESEAYWSSPQGIKRRQEEIASEIRQGLRDENGEWLVKEEDESENEEDDEEESEDE
jgi:hypothetical protein